MVASALRGVEQLSLALLIIENKYHCCSTAPVTWGTLGIFMPRDSDIPGDMLTAYSFSILSGWGSRASWILHPLRTEPETARVPLGAKQLWAFQTPMRCCRRGCQPQVWSPAVTCRKWVRGPLTPVAPCSVLPAAWRADPQTTHGGWDAGLSGREAASLFPGPLPRCSCLCRGDVLGCPFSFHFWASWVRPRPAGPLLSPPLLFALHFSYSLWTCDDAVFPSHLHRFQTCWQVLHWGLQALEVGISPEGKEHRFWVGFCLQGFRLSAYKHC